jgi:hypothetical protein
MIEDRNAYPDFVTPVPWSRAKISLMLGLVFIISVFSWYYYEYHYLPSLPIPLLKAEDGPTRIKPEGTDGILIPNTDKAVYEHFTPGSKDTTKSVPIMPEPEQPIKILQQEDQANADAIEDIIGKILSPEVKVQNNIDIVQESPASDSARVSTKTLNIVSVDKQDTNSRNMAASLKSKFPYKIQLVSVRSMVDAEAEWVRLKRVHHKALGHLPHFVQKITLGNKGIFYRLLVGQFSSFGQAKAICKKLGSSQGCLVISE